MDIQLTDAEIAYFNQGNTPVETTSSVLVSSSPYLNSAEFRTLLAQEMLRRNGPDVSITAYIPQMAMMYFKMENVARIIELFEEEKAKKPLFREWCDKKSLSNFKLSEVAHCAPGTLGAAIHHFMATSGYELEFMYKEIPVINDFTFYLRQTAVTHDIEHIVSGFGPNHGGEIALLEANLQAKARYFSPELAAYFNRFSTYLKAKTIMKDSLYYPEAHTLALEAQMRGGQQGWNWHYPLMLVDWRAHIDTPLDELRAQLGVTPVPEAGLWEGTNALSEDVREAAE